MNTNDVLNALSEATTAFHRVPELERELKTLTEDRDFTKLELEEAKAEIERLRADRESMLQRIDCYLTTIREHESEIADLQSRNTALDTSVNELVGQVNDLNLIRRDLNLRIDNLTATKASLIASLEDAKGYGARLADTLKSIGASIVAAVAEPEVSDSKPFPVSNSVGLSDSANAEGNRESVQSNPPALVEPPVPGVEVNDADLEGCVVNPGSSFNTPPADNSDSPGCHAYRYW